MITPGATHRYPSVAVIVLNYNGARYIERCLRSLLRLDYPSDRLELIVVDNASQDGSAEMVAERFPGVRLIQNPANWGFARGNNVGIRASRAEYVALLNNDTEVEPEWLGELVRVAEGDPRIGACTSKIRLFRRRLELVLTVTPRVPGAVSPGGDRGWPGVGLERVRIEGRTDRQIEGLEESWAFESVGGQVFRMTADRGLLGVPIEEGDEALELAFDLCSPPDGSRPSLAVELGIRGAAQLLMRGALRRGERQQWKVRLAGAELRQALPIIQNAGSLVFADGSGRDRGAVVQGTHAYYETDRGQYDAVEEVFAACGASVLLRRAMLEDAGLLDEGLFLYYEDTDLCWRARLRGWKIVYVPSSVVRHVHCGSSVEWSELFLFQTDRNRLAVLAKNGTPGQIVRAWGHYLLSTARMALFAARAAFGPVREPESGLSLEKRFRIRLQVLRSLAEAIPLLLRQRRTIQGCRIVGPRDIARWFQPQASRPPA